MGLSPSSLVFLPLVGSDSLLWACLTPSWVAVVGHASCLRGTVGPPAYGMGLGVSAVWLSFFVLLSIVLFWRLFSSPRNVPARSALVLTSIFLFDITIVFSMVLSLSFSRAFFSACRLCVLLRWWSPGWLGGLALLLFASSSWSCRCLCWAACPCQLAPCHSDVRRCVPWACLASPLWLPYCWVARRCVPWAGLPLSVLSSLWVA